MTLTIHDNVEQRTDAWFALRCGIITASVVGKLITPRTLKVASNEVARDVMAGLVAEQITGHVEPGFQTSDMLRGVLDEPIARDLYSEHHAPATEAGFMVRDEWGVQIGFSPDGLVGDHGLIEIKSRRQKKQLQTILADAVPVENMAQIQCGLLVSGRDWCDYVSYCGGMPLWVKRVEPDPKWHAVIIEAVQNFTELAEGMKHIYRARVDGLPETERIDHDMEIVI